MERRIHGGRGFAAFVSFLNPPPKVWTLPAVCNLISGSAQEVIDLLDKLGYGGIAGVSTDGQGLLSAFSIM